MRPSIAVLIGMMWCCPLFGQQQIQLKRPIKLVRDETSLLRVKAEPRQFLGKQIVLTGVARVDDYYNFGYEKAQASHYSLYFQQATAPTSFGETCHLYLLRDIGTEIVDAIISRTIDKKLDLVVIRAKVVLDPTHYEDNAWNHLELLDVQFVSADGDDWAPWIIEAQRKAAAEAEARRANAAEEAERQQKQSQERLAEQERAAKTRTWTDKTGRFAVIAEFRGIVGDKVLLRKKNGDVIKVPRARLSEADQKWIDERKKPKR